MTSTVHISGPVAQNKDDARAIRATNILPSLRSGTPLCLDFSGVKVATQSFIHALLSEAIRQFGESSLSLLEFRACVPQVRSAIETVAVYSLRARELRAREFSSQDARDLTRVSSTDVPQADDLTKVRAVVEALADGALPAGSVARETGFSLRHAEYRISAGRVLGLINVFAGIAMVTELGQQLLRSAPGTAEETQILRTAIETSPIIQGLAPQLLNPRLPDVNQLETRIRRLAKLSESTAARRARCLLSWRRQVLGPRQLSLADLYASGGPQKAQRKRG